MFDTIQHQFSNLFQRWRGIKKLSSEQLDSTLRELHELLIQADVALPVVENLMHRWREAWSGNPTLPAHLSAEQWLMKSVHQSLTETLGKATPTGKTWKTQPAVALLVGLQGSGKTTSAVKLAHYHQRHGQRVLLTSLDVYRPAARIQLQQLAQSSGVEVHGGEEEAHRSTESVLRLAESAVQTARARNFHLLILDTAGRLHLDEALMKELSQLVERFQPEKVWMVADAMWGQAASSSLLAFQARLPLSGTILTKLDADTKGGVALSVAGLTQAPIEFVGTGESVTDFEVFDAERMAQRIMGLGDLMGLIQTIEERVDQKSLEDQWSRGGKFDLDDLRSTLQQLQSMGGIRPMMERLPVALRSAITQTGISSINVARMQAILSSMTPKERKRPLILNASRKRRIARGAGVEMKEVQQLLKQYEMQRSMMHQMSNLGPMGLLKKAQSMFGLLKD